MKAILSFINDKMKELGCPYEYGEWTGEISYPYFVGEYQETDFRFEDNRTDGVFTLDGWSRNSKVGLMEWADKIKEFFDDLTAIRDDRCFFIRYSGTIPAPSGEADLYKVTITLNTNEWKGA